MKWNRFTIKTKTDAEDMIICTLAEIGVEGAEIQDHQPLTCLLYTSIPEITLVAILDADKEGFLRSEVSLIQTIGRAARNSEGHVIMYADVMTDSMRKAIQETERRRTIQEAYNKEHGITPTTIKKAVRDLITVSKAVAETEDKLKKDPESMTRKELTKLIGQVEKQMRAAAADLNFEQAAELRDKMIELKKSLDEMDE